MKINHSRTGLSVTSDTMLLTQLVVSHVYTQVGISPCSGHMHASQVFGDCRHFTPWELLFLDDGIPTQDSELPQALKEWECQN